MNMKEIEIHEGAGDAASLPEAACWELLHRRILGRVAIVVDGVPRVFPVNYIIDNGDIVFRTDEGMKLEAAQNAEIASFEVDHHDPLYHNGWSVLVTGVLEDITGDPERPDTLALPLRSWAGHGAHFIRLRPLGISGRRVVGG
jgi:nitroimidazol reductase NimA-like FMN-containing flavoprotein (pyridoxamine 5'-phosphate oxidase superfamily)